MQSLSLEELIDLSKKSDRIAVFREVSLKNTDPVAIYRQLSEAGFSDGLIFETPAPYHKAPCIYLGFNPLDSLCLHEITQTDPWSALRNFQVTQVYATRENMRELVSPIFGFLTYDIVRSIEVIPDRHKKYSDIPELLFHVYEISLRLCLVNKTTLISVLVNANKSPEIAYQQAQEKIDRVIALIDTKQKPKEASQKIKEKISVDVDLSDEDFVAKVELAKNYIKAGDAFQIVLSRCFKRHYSVSEIEIYNSLRKISPSPFLFYFPFQKIIFLGASPERMLCVRHEEITVNPIAGSRKRSVQDNNEHIETSLLNDEKELAEHRMLVDLARNDVGAVSEPGSVCVETFMQVKHYSHISHITSTVTGKLREKYDAFNAFSSAFPAGTLSGAPKIRAMEIIDALETSRRGLYGGAICRIDAAGNFDSCIAIRMAMLKEGSACVRTGAGIVYDSNAHTEAMETRQKAQSVLHAIADAQGEST